MHGAPPKDYPSSDLIEFFKLHMALEHSASGIPQAMREKHDTLDIQIRSWPRTAENDPFWDASYNLAKELSKITGYEVIVGFNEFCSPSIEDALKQAADAGSDEIIVITPMMTPGGEHSEDDIPQSIERVKKIHPHVSIRYAWPFDRTAVASFLSQQLDLD
jgi:sirohydrochlorin cobaltochelatase